MITPQQLDEWHTAYTKANSNGPTAYADTIAFMQLVFTTYPQLIDEVRRLQNERDNDHRLIRQMNNYNWRDRRDYILKVGDYDPDQ